MTNEFDTLIQDCINKWFKIIKPKDKKYNWFYLIDWTDYIYIQNDKYDISASLQYKPSRDNWSWQSIIEWLPINLESINKIIERKQYVKNQIESINNSFCSCCNRWSKVIFYNSLEEFIKQHFWYEYELFNNIS